MTTNKIVAKAVENVAANAKTDQSGNNEQRIAILKARLAADDYRTANKHMRNAVEALERIGHGADAVRDNLASFKSTDASLALKSLDASRAEFKLLCEKISKFVK